MNIKEKFIRIHSRHKGNVVHFRTDEVLLPNGKKATREYLDHPGAVGIIPVLKGNKIIMVQQYRHPVRKLTWEIPAGKLAKNEIPHLCAKRELEEETGYSTKKLVKLLAFWPTAAFANEVIHIYVAENMTKGKMNLDEDEFLRTEVWPLKKALLAIKTGKIMDSKTIVALLAYQTFSKQRRS